MTESFALMAKRHDVSKRHAKLPHSGEFSALSIPERKVWLLEYRKNQAAETVQNNMA
jgi:hypothetical protein